MTSSKIIRILLIAVAVWIVLSILGAVLKFLGAALIIGAVVFLGAVAYTAIRNRSRRELPR